MSSSAVVIPQNAAKKEQPKQEEWSTRYIVIGVTACIGGLIYQLITGSLYQWGIINIYVTSYYKTIDPSLTLESNAVAFPIMMFCMGLPMRFGIYLSEISHPMFMLLTCQILLSVSVLVASYMTSMWAFIFFYGILFGLLVGLSFMIPIVEINKYFPGKKNYVNGCLLVGTGSGSVVFGMFSYTYLNPEHLKPLLGYYIGSPQLLQIAYKVPTLLKYLALMYFLCGMLGIAMMTPVIMGVRRKQNEKLAQQIAKREQDQRNGIAVPQLPERPGLLDDHEAHSLKQAFTSSICWIEVTIVLFAACGLYLINGNYKTYVKASINDDYFLTIVGAIGAVANGCSRFVWNIFFLKTGYKTVMLIILGASITVYSTIRFTVHIQGVYLIEVLIINFCIGGLLGTTPTVVQAIYGQKTGSNIYGFYWQVVATANFIQYLFVSNLSKTIGFDNIIYICLGMACLAVPLVIFTQFEGPWHNQTDALQYCVGYHLNATTQKINHQLEQFQQHLEAENRTKVQKQPVILSPSKNQKLAPLNQQYILKTEVKQIHHAPENEEINNEVTLQTNKPQQLQTKLMAENALSQKKQINGESNQSTKEEKPAPGNDSKLDLKQIKNKNEKQKKEK